MNQALALSNRFPDSLVPNHTGTQLGPADVAKGRPLILCFVRGWWCPTEQVRLRMLVAMEDEIQREYARIAVREDEDGNEIVRGVWGKPVPEVGDPIERSDVDSRMWRVISVDEEDSRIAVRMRKEGPPSTDPLPMHHISAPLLVKIV